MYQRLSAAVIAVAVSAFSAMGQVSETRIRTKVQRFDAPLRAVVTLSATTRDLAPKLNVIQMPRPGSGNAPVQLPAQTERRAPSFNVTLPPPTVGSSSFGNVFDYYVPNDNDMAISDSGYIASVINCQILSRNTKTGQNKILSLASFANPVNTNHQEFDPKVLYDPENDRFILVCLSGFRDSTSKLIIGFSKTSDPSGTWNLYTLPGNPLNNNLWSDYPMIAITKKELFFTVNLLYEDSTWQKGFVETLIWQMRKDSGYVGKNLAAHLHSDIKYNNRPLRNICPVKGGSRTYGPSMYFLSNRNFAAQNDSVFLLKIADTAGTTAPAVTLKVLKTNQPYYFPADAWQPLQSQTLTTNDARTLGAFYENDRIQYVHNSNNPSNGRPTVYYGVINNPEAAAPQITGYLLPNDSLDYGYPNISYAGLDSADHGAIITFNHTSKQVFAGCSAVETDGDGGFSPIFKIRNGTGYVSILPDSDVERWGDYSGSQRRYSNPGEVWMSGFVGTVVGNLPAHRTWIAQIKTEKSLTVGVPSITAPDLSAEVFPNPTDDIVSVRLTLRQPEYLRIDLFDMQGKKLESLRHDWANGGQIHFSFRTTDLPKGVYLLKIQGDKSINYTQKVIVK